MKNIFNKQKGQTFTEYAIILVLFGLVVAYGSNELFKSTKVNYYNGLLPTNSVATDQLPPPPEGATTPNKQKPVANINGPLVVHQGDWVTYTNTSTASNGTTVKSVSWGGYASSQAGNSIRIQFPDAGTYQITLTVIDSNGMTDTKVIQVQVGNQKPNAVISISPENQSRYKQEVTISSAGSSDPDGDEIVASEWRMDGQLQDWPKEGFKGVLPTGNHTISLRVQDVWGAWSDPVSKNYVVLENEKPVAVIKTTPNDNPAHNQNVTISGNESYDPNDDQITKWLWTLNGVEQSWSLDGTSMKFNTGTHTITLKVADEQGLWSDVVTKTITVAANRAPVTTISMTPTTNLKSDTSITFTNQASDPDGDSIVATQWQSDGGAVTTSPPNGKFTSGSHTVQVRVQDSGGLWSSWASITFTVEQSYVPVNMNFNYTGSVQNFVAPSDGTYKIEVWGAQGGTAGFVSGGLGGYSTGTIQLRKGDIFNIYVGGQGGRGLQNGSSTLGGYNGGGSGGYGADSAYAGGGGGGATDIRLNGTSLSNRIIVAGGGGGATTTSTGGYGFQGGSGGGLSGESGSGDNTTAIGKGGTQTTGGQGGNGGSNIGGNGTLGQGGRGTGNSYEGGGGGGGGYYGGGAGGAGNGPDGSAGGGSGYIGGVTNGRMINSERAGNGYVHIESITP